MTQTEQAEIPDEFEFERHQSRLSLIWAVLVFQAKLIVDGLRDLVLVPISLVAALIGLIAGGNEPDRYFQKILGLGRRSEIWINLFGHRKHAATADSLIEPLKQKVMSETEQREWVQKAGQQLNKTLDKVNQRVDSAVSAREESRKEERREQD